MGPRVAEMIQIIDFLMIWLILWSFIVLILQLFIMVKFTGFFAHFEFMLLLNLVYSSFLKLRFLDASICLRDSLHSIFLNNLAFSLMLILCLLKFN